MKTKEINRRIAQGLIKMGAKRLPDPNFSRFAIYTKHGELVVTLAEPRPRATILSCYSRFTDVDSAKTATTCNPYSGKWNWVHFSNQFTDKSFANMVLSDIEKILPDITSREFWENGV